MTVQQRRQNPTIRRSTRTATQTHGLVTSNLDAILLEPDVNRTLTTSGRQAAITLRHDFAIDQPDRERQTQPQQPASAARGAPDPCAY